MDQQPQLSGRLGKTGQASEKSLSSTHSNLNGSGTRNNLNRKTNVKSQGAKFRDGVTAAAETEYHKHGPSSDTRKEQRSLRGASEGSTKRLSGLALNTHAAATMRESTKLVNALDEEKKTGTISSKSNSIATGAVNKKGVDSTKGVVVLKKKKTKAGDRESSQMTKSTKSKKINVHQMNSSQAPSEISNSRKDDPSATTSDAPSKKLKSTSSASVRNKNQNARKISAQGISVDPSDQKLRVSGGISQGGAAMTDQLMKSTFKSNLINDDHTVSGWNESQSENDSKKMIDATQASMAQKTAHIKTDNVSPDNTTREVAALEGDQEATTTFAVNQPASPASKAAPKLKIQVPATTLDMPQDSIEEIDDEALSPTTIASPMFSTNLDRAEEANTFGIKLQRLDQSSTMALPATYEKQKEAVTNQDSQEASFLESPSSIKGISLQQSAEKGEKTGPDAKVIQPELTEPLPILPKVTSVFQMPVKCPIENIRFVNLKRFQQYQKQQEELMSEGYDLVGNRRKMIQQKTEDKIKKGGNDIENQDQLAKIDDTTHFIKSIVFARDPKIIDQEKKHVHQRDAFSHLNNLDIKALISKTQLMTEESKYPNLSPRSVQRRMPRDLQPKQFLDSQVYKLKDAEDKTLLFESRFESGNLYLAQKVSDLEYNLLMSNDINTQGHTQWFFFQVKNTRAKQKVRFNILNYSKPDSLFNYGMKVSVYSDKKSEHKKMGWHKDGEDIRYFQNGIRKDVTYYSKSYYTATFTYTFEYSDDLVYFAYSTPYTYSDLRNDLTAIETDPNRSRLVKKKTLCRTLSGEACEVLTITSADNLENFPQRKGVVITARVHPGETVGSWMMRGVLTFLTDPENTEAKILRENFVFKVIPMLNPDGVINGNYRCSLAGCDLNRRWKVPSKMLHPTIFYTKRLVKQIHNERGLVLFCDLHGHSRKQNVFMYGCNNKQNPGECRIFPFILSNMNKYFCYEYSRFGVQKSKESTARVALYKELKNVPNIFTMESSFAGLDMGPAAGKHLTTEMLETLGHDVCRAVLIYSNLYVPPELRDIPFFKNILIQQQKNAAAKKGASTLDKKKFKEPAFSMKDAIMGAINADQKLINNAGGDDSSSGSDSAPSEDNMQAEELIKQLPMADKTLKLQLKKNQDKKKEEEAKNAQSMVKLRRQSSGRNLKRMESPRRQMSPLKRPLVPEKKEEQKPEEPKKKKVETRDACTQTERSDYQVIKQKQQLKERKQKEQEAALALARSQRANQATGGLVVTDRMILNDLNRPADFSQAHANANVKMQQNLNTSQRLQQMVSMNDPKSRSNPIKLPLTQTFTSNQLKALSGQQHVQNYQPSGQSKTEKSSRNGGQEQTQQQQLGSSQRIMIPDKNKYNFMGVSSIKQGPHVQPGYMTHDNEYGTHVKTSNQTSPSKQGISSGATSVLAAASKQIYQTQGQQEKIDETLQIGQKAKNMELSMNLSHKDSRKSENRGQLGKTELPAMNQLNSNTHSTFKDHIKSQQPPPGIVISSMKNTVMTNRVAQGAIQSQNYPLGKRIQNFDTEPSTQRNGVGAIFGNSAITVDGKPQFVLPQTKQLPQKEFVMMEVGAKGSSNRRGSRNAKPSNTSSQLANAQSANQAYHQGQPNINNGNPNGNPNPAGVSRFYSQRSKPLSNATEQTLIRNNSTHSKPTGKYTAPLGASPMVQKGQPPNKNQVDIYSSQLQEMPLSQTIMTRNTGGNSVSQNPSVPENLIGGPQQPLRVSMQVENASPIGRKQNIQPWKTGSEVVPGGQQYRAMGGEISMNHSQLEHSEHCGNRLPELNLRQQQKGQTVGGPSGVIGGLNIVLKSGQGSLHTPQSKKPFQKAKFQNQIMQQPQQAQPQAQMISTSLVQGVKAGSQKQQWILANNQGGSLTTTNGAAASMKVGGEISSNTSAATHKRSKAHGSMQNMTQQQMSSAAAKNGSRTPSSNEMHRASLRGNEILSSNPRNKAQKSLIVGLNIGSVSLEEGQAKDFQNRSPQMKQQPASNGNRLRNQSEIAETRNQKSNYETYDAKGPNQMNAKYETTPGISVNSVLTPQVNYNKRSMIQNNSQAKVVGKRYSRH